MPGNMVACLVMVGVAVQMAVIVPLSAQSSLTLSGDPQALVISTAVPASYPLHSNPEFYEVEHDAAANQQHHA